MLTDKNILLIVSGGIAAYKVLDLIRMIRKNNGNIRCILTNGGAQFVTPLSISALSQNPVYSDLWSLQDEAEMGHIRLSRENDLIIVAPASADIIAKMAHGLASDLATTTLLASDKPIMVAPAMNLEMWNHPATKHNIKTLQLRGITLIGPENGDLACGETGMGRMSDPDKIFTEIKSFFSDGPLKGHSAIVTAGPTYEAIDPVRFLGNRSSGKQGIAIADELNKSGAYVTLILGPSSIPLPTGINVIHVESAQDMLDATKQSLPADIAICTAAVSDWSASQIQNHKIKKDSHHGTMSLALKKNPDILHIISNHKSKRPKLVIGFAAETHDLVDNAKNKLKQKGCDWIIANEVGPDDNGAEKAFGCDQNEIYFISQDKEEKWPRASKKKIAKELIEHITEHMKKNDTTK